MLPCPPGFRALPLVITLIRNAVWTLNRALRMPGPRCIPASCKKMKPWAVDLRAQISTSSKQQQAHSNCLRPSPIRTLPSVPASHRLNRFCSSWTYLSALPPVGNWLETPASPCPEDLLLVIYFCLNLKPFFGKVQQGILRHIADGP